MHMFETFINQIESGLTAHDEAHVFVPQMRNHMQVALANESFVHECIQRSLATIENSNNKNQWISPPIYHNPEKRIAARLIPWPAFYCNNPHKHKTWGVTGVFYNKLDVFTYEILSKDPIKLKKKKNIAAVQHEAGYILPDCIHNIGNPSSETSISIHIFNNLPNIENSEENAIWYPAPSKDNLKEGFLSRTLIAFSNCISELTIDDKFNTLQRIFNIGNVEVKLSVIKVLVSQAPELADQLYTDLKNLKQNK